MIAPECPPPAVQDLPMMVRALPACVFGTLAVVAAAAWLKVKDYASSIRERRLRALHPPYKEKP